MNPPRSLPAARLAPLAPAVATLALGAVALGAKSLWYDETYTAWTIRGSWDRLWSLIQDHEAPHGLYYALLKTWTTVAGTSETALRLPSVVAAAAAAAVVVLLGRRLLGPGAGLLGGFLVGTSPFVVIWSQQARSYAFALLAVAASTLALTAALERPSRVRWAVYAVIAALSLLVHPFAALVLPAHALATLVRRPPSPPALAAFLAVAAAAVAVLAETGSRNEELTAWIPEPDAGELASALLLVCGFTPIPIVTGALGLRALWRRGARWQAALLGTWAVGPFAATLAYSVVVRPVFASRYLIVAVPAFALLTAAWAGGARRVVAVATLTAIFTASAVVVVLWYRAPSLEDWRTATTEALALRDAGAEVVVAPPPALTGFEYYAGKGTARFAVRGDEAWVLTWSASPEERLRAGARAAGPGYELREERAVDAWLTLQRWAR